MKSKSRATAIAFHWPTLLVFAAMVVCSAPADAATYYVDASNGSDAHDGASERFPFKTIAHLSARLAAGDTALLKAGERWDELLVVERSGVTYGRYAEGPDPLISAADRVTGWTLASSQGGVRRYAKKALGWKPNYLWMRAQRKDSICARASSLAEADAPGEWFHDADTDTLYVITLVTTDLNTADVEVNVGRRDSCIKGGHRVSNVTIRHLHLKFTNAAGFWGSLHATSDFHDNWLIEDCLIEWGNLGIKISGKDFSAPHPRKLTLRNVETRYCREHGIQAEFFSGALVEQVHSHDNGRMGVGLIARDSVVQDCEFDHNAGKNDLWPAGQRATVAGYDAGLYLVGSAAKLIPAGNNTVQRCVAHHNAKAGLAVDALSDNNTFQNCVVYRNDLMGIFLEGGTENGSFGNRIYHCTIYANARAGRGSGINVQNGHGGFDIRNNILFGNGDKGTQDVFLRFDISGTWRPHAGSTYKRNHVRWAPARVAQDDQTELTRGARGDALRAGEWFYDASSQTLYVHKTDGTAPTSVHCVPADGWIMDGNVYSTDARAVRIRFDNPGAGGRAYATLAPFRADTNQELHGVEAEPRYVSPDGQPPDFHLLSDSPVLGIGSNVKVTEDFDRGGRAREGVTPGAYEGRRPHR